MPCLMPAACVVVVPCLVQLAAHLVAPSASALPTDPPWEPTLAPGVGTDLSQSTTHPNLTSPIFGTAYGHQVVLLDSLSLVSVLYSGSGPAWGAVEVWSPDPLLGWRKSGNLTPFGLPQANAAAAGNFGSTVSASEEWAFVGQHLLPIDASHKGTVHAYRRQDDGSWLWTGNLVSPAPTADAYWGSALASRSSSANCSVPRDSPLPPGHASAAISPCATARWRSAARTPPRRDDLLCRRRHAQGLDRQWNRGDLPLLRPVQPTSLVAGVDHPGHCPQRGPAGIQSRLRTAR